MVLKLVVCAGSSFEIRRFSASMAPCCELQGVKYTVEWDSSVVRAPDLWLKGCGFKSLPERRDKIFLRGQLSVLTLILVSIPPPCYHKRSLSLCQKCRWEVTAEDAYTLSMWLCMKWHGAWLYGVHRMCQDSSSFMWSQPCQRCKYTTLVDIQKRAIKKLVTHVESHASAVSLFKSREQRYKKAIIIIIIIRRSSEAVWESRWMSWAVHPNEPSGFHGRKDLLNCASALVTTCP